jgi:hypothetical protein
VRGGYASAFPDATGCAESKHWTTENTEKSSDNVRAAARSNSAAFDEDLSANALSPNHHKFGSYFLLPFSVFSVVQSLVRIDRDAVDHD